MKKLNLVFNTSGKAMTVSLTDPKEGLTLEECRTAAEKAAGRPLSVLRGDRDRI